MNHGKKKGDRTGVKVPEDGGIAFRPGYGALTRPKKGKGGRKRESMGLERLREPGSK